MKNRKFFLVLLVVLTPFFVHAQTQNVEFCLQVGGGSFWNDGNGEKVTQNYVRENEFAWIHSGELPPASESYGGLVRYRFDYRWTLQAQAMRQRVRFKETPKESEDGLFFYNSMWNVDLMTEFNILKYGFKENRNAKVYTVTPYVAVGIGTSLYNKHATYRFDLKTGAKNTPYPLIRAQDLAAAMYIPFGIGVKLRMEFNWQLKLACQYNLYVLNGDLNGSTNAIVEGSKHEFAYEGRTGDGVDLGAYKAASSHNIVATVGVIYNLPANDRRGSLVTDL